MNALVVMPSAHAWGGAEEALLQLVEHRNAAGFSKLTVVFLEHGELVEAVRGRGVHAEVIPAGRLREPWKFVRCVGKLRSWLVREKPDVVVGWMSKAHLYGGLAAWFAAVPAIYFQMGNPDDGIVDVFCRFVPASGALACSEFVARQQRVRTKVAVQSVALGFDSRRFDEVRSMTPAEARAKLGLPATGVIVGIVGRLQRWKGMHVFVDAMKIVTKERPDCLGIIVGGKHDQEAEYEEELRGRIEAAGLQHEVRMTGRQTNVPEWMQAMDVVVHASDQEPFGIVVVEAMALGKPVIATQPGGPDEIITDQVDGQLVPFEDASALAKAISRYLEEAAFARRCGEMGQERAAEFTSEKFARRTGMALRSLLPRAEVAGAVAPSPCSL